METDIPLGLTWWIANFDDCGERMSKTCNALFGKRGLQRLDYFHVFMGKRAMGDEKHALIAGAAIGLHKIAKCEHPIDFKLDPEFIRFSDMNSCEGHQQCDEASD